jgi:hypothetical protein
MNPRRRRHQRIARQRRIAHRVWRLALRKSIEGMVSLIRRPANVQVLRGSVSTIQVEVRITL